MHDKNATTVNPYLMFEGNCAEAMNFYKTALNGTLETMPFEGSPVEVPDNYKDKILHSTLKFGDAVIMASDGIPGQKYDFGNGTHISISVNTLDEAKTFFKNLSDGGKITMPFEKTFWGASFGMLTDRFGINWMVNCDEKD